MNNKPLRLAQGGKKPGALAKKIINSQGGIVGYIKGNTVYDSGGYLMGNDACGYLDSNKNLFDLRGRYVGTVKRGLSLNFGFAVVIITLLIALLGCSLYYSSYIMSKMGLNIYNPEYPSISLSQNGTNWSQLETLDIFGGGADGRPENAFVRKAIIPGTVGTYNFVLSNDGEEPIQFNMQFTDENTYRIPMRFRLMNGNAFIVGSETDWVSIADLQCQQLLLLGASRNLFTLEWKWAPDVDDAADTAAGQASAASYTLNIQLDAELTNLA